MFFLLLLTIPNAHTKENGYFVIKTVLMLEFKISDLDIQIIIYALDYEAK